ncbi:aldo/keto reductase [Listeria booriae]|uniref:aldo/keto reductase n=1 Tax=Listeria booriae TaxID=1552123 RepID=UPI0016235B84|nr:aldo/keto reductase [Listeria booriae]MBC1273805.1 aldo/keto reductase [Listeria booriae]
MKTVKLANGTHMPVLGLGVFKVEEGAELVSAIKEATRLGYRSIDTAAIYGNETSVGQGIRESGIPREDLFITSKVWNADLGYEATLAAFDESLHKMELDYLDLYLIHWPVEGKYTDAWRALEKLHQDGRIRAIGVSNFQIHHLETLKKTATIMPVINQIELHPQLTQKDLIAYCAKNNIRVEAWSPLMQGGLFDNPTLQEIATRHGKSVAQVILRWDLQNDIIVIPKSTKPHRIAENMAIFDFELSDEECAQIDALNQNLRVGPDPDNIDF